MLTLAITSSTDQAGCAIAGYEGVLGSAHVGRGRRHAETLAPTIEFCCEQTGVSLDDLGAVAVDIGPGLFTGLRVGLATAKAIAGARRLGLIGLSSLDLLAHRARFTDRLIASVIDARRSQVFWATYRQVPGGVQRITGPVAAEPDEVASELVATGADVLAIGDGALRYAEILATVGGVEVVEGGFAHPSARTLATLAHARALREEWADPAEVAPLYLRAPDVAINWDSRAPASPPANPLGQA